MRVFGESNAAVFEVAVSVAVISVFFWLLSKTQWKRFSVRSIRNDATNERPLGALEMFFEEAHQNGGPFICCTIVRIQSSVSLSQAVVRHTLVILAKKHPLLRAKITSPKNGAGNKCFVVNNETEPLIPLKILSTVSANEFLQTMEKEMHKDFKNNLLWRVIYFKENHNLERNVYENSILFVTHHAVTDGISAIILTGQFSTHLNEVAKGSALNIDNIQSYPLTKDVCALIADEIVWPWWQKTLLFPQALTLLFKAFQLFVKIKPMENIFLQSFPEASSKASRGSELSRIVYEEMTEEETKRLIDSCKVNDCTVQGAVAAAWHLATRKLLLLSDSKVQNANPVFQWYCPVSVRKSCKPIVPDGYLGCYVSSVIDRFQVPDIRTSHEFWTLAQRCSHVIHDQIHRKQHLRLLRVYDFLDLVKFIPEFKLVTRDAAVHGLTNMGCFEWRKKEAVFKTVQCFLATGNHHYGMIFQNHISTVNGRFNVATTYCDTVVKESTAKQMQKLAFSALKNNGVL